MVREMTHGKPLPLILQFCIPMLLGNLFQQLYSMADTVIVGKFIDVNALAAVGSTGAVNFLIIGFTMGITSGSCILPSQKFGAGDYSEMRRYVANAMYLCLVTTIIVTTLATVLCRPLLVLMNTPLDIIDMAYDYIILIFYAIPITMLYNLLAGILRAMGDSRTPLYFLILASVVNIGLDLLFIIVFNMGVAGAGLATVCAQAVSAVLCLVYIRRSFSILRFEREEMKISGQRIAKLASIGVPMGLQFSITAIGSIMLQTAVNSLGTVYVAAVTAAGKLQNIVAAPMETLGITMATYGGQNLGARKISRITEGVRKAYVVGLGYSIAAAVLMCLLAGPMCLLFIDAAETSVIDNCVYFLRINALFYPVLLTLFFIRNLLQGLGFSLLPMMAGVSELIGRGVVSFGFVALFQFNAVCFASPVAWTAATILLVITYFVKMKKLRRDYAETAS